MIIKDGLTDFVKQTIADLPSFFSDPQTALDNMRQRFEDMAKNTLSTIGDKAQERANNILLDMLGNFGGGGGGAGGGGNWVSTVASFFFADGGMVSGPGGPRDDKIPAMLSNGEAVIPAASVSKNYDTVRALINGNSMPRFADGGIVGGFMAPTTPPTSVMASTQPLPDTA